MFLVFPVDGAEREWKLLESKVQKYEAHFPALDVRQQCRDALLWIEDHPGRRKTTTGMSAFLTGWLKRAQNSNGRTTQANGVVTTTRKETASEKLERLRRDEECQQTHTTNGEAGTRHSSQ